DLAGPPQIFVSQPSLHGQASRQPRSGLHERRPFRNTKAAQRSAGREIKVLSEETRRRTWPKNREIAPGSILRSRTPEKAERTVVRNQPQLAACFHGQTAFDRGEDVVQVIRVRETDIRRSHRVSELRQTEPRIYGRNPIGRKWISVGLAGKSAR